MKRQKYLTILSILAALILSLVVFVPVSADRPEYWTFSVAFDWTFDQCVQEGEPVIIPGYLEETYYNTVFFDNNGIATYSLDHARGTATLTYNGRTLTMHDVLNHTYTWPSDTQTIIKLTGSDWIGTVPGHGPVVGIAGNHTRLETCHMEGDELVCDTEMLKFSGMDFTDYEAVCNYLLYGE